MEEGKDFINTRGKTIEQLDEEWKAMGKPPLAFIDDIEGRLYLSKMLPSMPGEKNKSHIPWLKGK
ncbi:MAG: hypothetical protein V4478_03265 [Patescibacteria group bacterium]